MKPLVSVIIPCYNHAHYLADALNSVFQQSYKNWECVIVNDASTDNTIVVAVQWVKKDSRFKLVNAVKNGGLAASRNLGIANCNGEFILPLDADDMIDSTYLDVAVPFLKGNNELKLVFTDAKHFGSHENIQHWKHFSMMDLCFQNQLHCTALYRRTDYDQTKGYRTNMQYGYEDWDFWMQLLTAPTEVKHIPLPLFYVRAKDNAMHHELLDNENRERSMRQQLRINNPGFFERHSKRYESLPRRVLRKLKSMINGGQS